MHRSVGTVALLLLAAGTRTCSALENGLARTPPLGWRSWNLFGLHIDDQLMYRIAEGITNRSRLVNGTPASLADLGGY